MISWLSKVERTADRWTDRMYQRERATFIINIYYISYPNYHGLFYCYYQHATAIVFFCEQYMVYKQHLLALWLLLSPPLLL